MTTQEEGYDVRAGVRGMLRYWPDVKEGKKHGLAAFSVNRRLFLLCGTDAVVFTCLSVLQREEAARLYRAEPYLRAGKEHADWCRVPCRTRLELLALEGLIRNSYEANR